MLAHTIRFGKHIPSQHSSFIAKSRFGWTSFEHSHDYNSNFVYGGSVLAVLWLAHCRHVIFWPWSTSYYDHFTRFHEYTNGWSCHSIGIHIMVTRQCNTRGGWTARRKASWDICVPLHHSSHSCTAVVKLSNKGCQAVVYQKNSIIYVHYSYSYYEETFKIPYVWDFDVNQILPANTFIADKDGYDILRTYQFYIFTSTSYWNWERKCSAPNVRFMWIRRCIVKVGMLVFIQYTYHFILFYFFIYKK